MIRLRFHCAAIDVSIDYFFCAFCRCRHRFSFLRQVEIAFATFFFRFAFAGCCRRTAAAARRLPPLRRWPPMAFIFADVIGSFHCRRRC